MTGVNNIDFGEPYADLMDAIRAFVIQRLAVVVALLTFLASCPSATGQTLPDAGFGGLGAGFVNLPLNQGGLDRDLASDMKIRPDGRIVIAGPVQTATGVVAGVYQLTADGRPDPSFGGGDGRATSSIQPHRPFHWWSLRWRCKQMARSCWVVCARMARALSCA